MRRFALAGISLVLAACSSAPASAPASGGSPPQTGVFVDTDRGPIALNAFSLGLAHQLPVRNHPHSVPRVRVVKAFVVNVPNVTGADAAVYWVNDPDLIFSGSQEPLESKVSDREQGGYTISTPSLGERSSGFAMLVLKSPGGGPSRYYAVALGAS
ncbi:MAG: hypothetical protein ACM3SQ_08225 [Betaproteobacteria bacterium]